MASNYDNRYGSFITTHAVANVSSVRSQILPINRDRKISNITNIGNVTIFIGDSTVNSSNGQPLQPGATLYWENFGALNAVTGGGTGTLALSTEST